MFEKKELNLGRVMQAITIASNEIDLKQNLDENCINGCMAPIFWRNNRCYALEKINVHSNIAIYIMEYNHNLPKYEIDQKDMNHYELGISICDRSKEIGKFFGHLSLIDNQELYRNWEIVLTYFYCSPSRRTVNTINKWSQDIVQNKDILLQDKRVEKKPYMKRKWYSR